MVKSCDVISKARLFVLVCATICYIFTFFLSGTYQAVFSDTCLLLLVVQFMLRAVEIAIESKKEKNAVDE